VNADGIENDLPCHHCDDKNDRGIDRSTQRGATPLRAGKRCGQPGKNCHIADRINGRPNSGEIFANLDEQRRYCESRTAYTRDSATARESYYVEEADGSRLEHLTFGRVNT